MRFWMIPLVLTLFGVAVEGGAPDYLPENSNCASAIELIPNSGLHIGNSEGVEVNENDSCAFTGPSPALWYSVVGTGERINVNTCSSVTNFDTVISIARGSCDYLECLEFNDDFCGLSSSVSFESEPYVTYYIRVGGYARASGVFGLTVSTFEPPVNDNREGAIELLIGHPVAGSMAGATGGDGSFCSNSSDTDPGVWFYFEGTGSSVEVTTCSRDTSDYGWIQVLTEDLSCYAYGYDDYSCSFVGTSASFFAEAGVRYYILYTTFGTLDSTFVFHVNEIEPLDNGTCETAEVVDVSTLPTYVDGTTAGALVEYSTCDFFTADSKGAWYTFTGTGQGMALSTCSGNLEFHSGISIYVGTCSPLAIECVSFGLFDNYCAVSYFTASRALIQTEVGVEYKVFVHGIYTDARGTFTLSFEEVEIAENDVCQNAILIYPDYGIIEGSTTYATDSGATECSSGGNSPDVWYEVIGTGTHLMASLCSDTTDFDTQLSVYVKDEYYCDSMCIDGNDDSSCGLSSELVWFAEMGVTYTIRVHGFGDQFGNFALNLTTFEGSMAPNDHCQNATDIYPGDFVSGRTFDATWSGDVTCDDFYFDSPDVWYRVIGIGSNLVASTCGPGTDYDSYLSIHEGTCDYLQCVAGNDDACGALTSEVEWFAAEGEVYYIRVHGFSSESGSFTLNLTATEDTGGSVENDFCQDATEIYPGDVLYGNTSSATWSGDETCYGFATYNSSDVWYRVVGMDTTLTASTCGYGTDYDSYLSIHGGTCDYLYCVAGNDDACGLASEVSWFAAEGEVYYIRVHGYESSSGSFTLNLTTSDGNGGSAENDFCQDATEIYPGDILYGNTSSATWSGDETCGSPFTFNSPDVWYRVIGMDSTLLASTCGYGTDYDSYLSIHGGTCDEIYCVAGNDDACGGLTSEVAWFAAEGEVYYIRVHGFASDTGSFTLNLTTTDPIGGNVENDFCQNATEVWVGDFVYGSTVNATWSGDETCNSSSTYSSPDVWYRIVGTNEPILASTCGYGTNYDSYLSIYGGTCGYLDCVAGNDDACGALTSEVEWFGAEGEVYYIRVHGFGSSSGSFTLNLTIPDTNGGGSAENDLCQHAIEIWPGDTLYGNTDHATWSGDETCFGFANFTSSDVWYRVVGMDSTLVASTCGDDTLYDSYLSIYGGTCDYLYCVAGNDDACGSTTSEVEWFAAEGEVYYIRVHGYEFFTGPFVLTLNEVDDVDIDPVSDTCEGAIPLYLNSEVVGSTLAANPDYGLDYCGDATDVTSNSVWYSVYGNGGSIIVSTCSHVTNFDTQISVFTGDCNDLYYMTCVAGSDQYCGDHAEVHFHSVYGQQYYIVVHGYGFSTGIFQLSVYPCEDGGMSEDEDDYYVGTKTTKITSNQHGGRRRERDSSVISKSLPMDSKLSQKVSNEKLQGTKEDSKEESNSTNEEMKDDKGTLEGSKEEVPKNNKEKVESYHGSVEEYNEKLKATMEKLEANKAKLEVNKEDLEVNKEKPHADKEEINASEEMLEKVPDKSKVEAYKEKMRGQQRKV